MPESEDCGPYETKAEADEDRVGLEKTERWGHLHQFWTSKKKASKQKKIVAEVKKPMKKTAKKKKVNR